MATSGTLMLPLSFTMFTAICNSTQKFSYFIPEQPFLETFIPLSDSNQDHTFMGDYIIPANSKHDFCYDDREAYPLQQKAISILLIFFGDLFSSLQNLKDYQLLAKHQMPAQPSYTCFPSSLRRPIQRLTFNSSLYWTSKIENLTASSFFSFIFLLI